MKQEHNNENEDLRMDSVRLTKNLIEEISDLQAGCTPGHIFKDSDFENSLIDEYIRDIIKTMDFLIMLYGGSGPADETEYLDHLDVLRHCKNHFEAFRAPIIIENKHVS